MAYAHLILWYASRSDDTFPSSPVPHGGIHSITFEGRDFEEADDLANKALQRLQKRSPYFRGEIVEG